MSWLFSRALVEEYSAANCSDGEQSVQLNGNLIPQAFCVPDKMTAFSRLSRFGMTFKPLTESRGEELLMSYLAGFRARTSAQPEKAQGLTESDQGCGEKWRGSFARYDPATHSLRTHQCSLFEDLTECCVTLPQWGLMRRGECWEQQTLAQTIRGTGFGLSPDGITTFHTPNTTGLDGGSNSRRALKKRMKSWPTPQANDNRDRGSAGSGAVQRRMAKGKQIMLSQSVDQNSGQLNPTWVEKLMGWADNWTSLEPISHIKMMFWLMGNVDGQERRTAEILRVLRQGNAAQEIQREIGRPVNISEAALLLSELCEHANRPDEARLFMACAEALGEEVRGVRVYAGAASASHRPRQSEQHAREHSDALQTLSRFLAHHGQARWQDGSWEDATPRVADGVAARVDRLKAIGNGQVPLCAATAWKILSGELA